MPDRVLPEGFLRIFFVCQDFLQNWARQPERPDAHAPQEGDFCRSHATASLFREGGFGSGAYGVPGNGCLRLVAIDYDCNAAVILDLHLHASEAGHSAFWKEVCP